MNRNWNPSSRARTAVAAGFTSVGSGSGGVGLPADVPQAASSVARVRIVATNGYLMSSPSLGGSSLEWARRGPGLADRVGRTAVPAHGPAPRRPSWGHRNADLSAAT